MTGRVLRTATATIAAVVGALSALVLSPSAVARAAGADGPAFVPPLSRVVPAGSSDRVQVVFTNGGTAPVQPAFVLTVDYDYADIAIDHTPTLLCGADPAVTYECSDSAALAPGASRTYGATVEIRYVAAGRRVSVGLSGAAGIVYDIPSAGAWFHEESVPGGPASRYAHYGDSSDQNYLVGDWDGDGVATLAVERGNLILVTNDPAGGRAQYSYRFGTQYDRYIVGDWDGDGRDTIGVVRENVWLLTDNPRGGPARKVVYGSDTDSRDNAVVGDWNGDGRTTFGIRRDGNLFLLTDNPNGGKASHTYRFGSVGDQMPVVGDWDGNGTDTLGVQRASTYLMTNTSGGNASLTFRYGDVGDVPYVGDWDGNHRDAIAVRRPTGP